MADVIMEEIHRRVGEPPRGTSVEQLFACWFEAAAVYRTELEAEGLTQSVAHLDRLVAQQREIERIVTKPSPMETPKPLPVLIEPEAPKSPQPKLLNEPVLEDDYPIYAGYAYVADGKVITSDLHGVTAREYRARERVTELRRCDLHGRGLL